MADWRLQGQEKYLKGDSLRKQEWRRYRENWDHDHCDFCWATFSESPEDLHVGYVTSDGLVWICSECYEDFKELFQWTVVEG